MSETVDVNVLVYGSNQQAPEYERAAALLHHLAAGPDLVVLLWPVLMGYLRIATHPSAFAAPLSFDQAAGNVDALFSLPHVRVVGEGAGFWATLQDTTEGVRVRGTLVPDAHIVA